MRFRQSSLLVSLVILSACSSQLRTVPPVTTAVGAPQGFGAVEPALDAKGGFGVGLDAESYISGRGISKSYAYCQTPGYQFEGCPGHMPGLTQDAFRFKKRHGTQMNVANAASARLGRFHFSQSAAGDSEDFYEEAGSYTTFHWTDTLHVTSGTLRAGTPVTFKVSLSLTSGSSGVYCNRLDSSFGGLGFKGTGTDAYGETLDVQGFCYYPSEGYYGEFVYSAGNSYPATPTDTGTIETAVGKSFKIGVIGSVYTSACGDPRYCSFETTSGLSGIVSWKIERETSGAGYTTDSGTRYGG